MQLVEELLLLSENAYLIISAENQKQLLTKATVIAEEDTFISDKIRIVSLADSIFVQETTNKQEILIRKLKSISEAEELLKQRLEIYEKMWDGCGCKVDYYS